MSWWRRLRGTMPASRLDFLLRQERKTMAAQLVAAITTSACAAGYEHAGGAEADACGACDQARSDILLIRACTRRPGNWPGADAPAWALAPPFAPENANGGGTSAPAP